MSDSPALFSDGGAYERMMGRWSQLVGASFIEWLGLPKGLRWLDVGCGNGAFTELLIARTAPADVIGVDPSEGQLAYARTRPGASAAQFRLAGAQALPFGEGSFDAAIMALVISFVPDPLQAVREMARVVRPGGCVAAYMWDIPGGGLPLQPLHVAMQSIGVPSPNPAGYEASRLSAMQAVWQQAGLRSIDSRVIRIPVRYSGFDDFWNSNTVPIGPAGKAISELAPEMKERLKAHLREQLRPGPDGSISFEAFANAVKGVVPG